MGPLKIAIITGIMTAAIIIAFMVQPHFPRGPYDGCNVRTNQTHIIQLEQEQGSATCGALINDLTEKGWKLHTYTDPFLARPQYVLVYPPTTVSSDANTNVNATAVDTLPLRCSGKGCPLPLPP